MKKLLAVLLLLAAPAFVRGDVVALFAPGSSGLVLDGHYGPSAGQSDTTDWVDCNAYICDGRVIAVGDTGAVDVIWECKGQLTDTAEQPYPCYRQTTMSDPTIGLFSSLARAGYYRLKLINRGSGTFKAWVIRVKR